MTTVTCVPFRDAVKALEIGESTLRRWIARREVAAVKQVGRWHVFLLVISGGKALALPYSALDHLIGQYAATMAGEDSE